MFKGNKIIPVSAGGCLLTNSSLEDANRFRNLARKQEKTLHDISTKKSDKTIV